MGGAKRNPGWQPPRREAPKGAKEKTKNKPKSPAIPEKQKNEETNPIPSHPCGPSNICKLGYRLNSVTKFLKKLNPNIYSKLEPQPPPPITENPLVVFYNKQRG